MLRGPSGSGKTTLFRVLAGLWPFGRGRVGLPKDARVLFLPQKPYLPIGTLREVLSYPETPEHYTEEACREVLEACGLGHLVPRLDETDQLVAGAVGRRAAAPGLRARAALPPELAVPRRGDLGARRGGRAAHVRAAARALPGATVISIAHRPTVVALHKRQLVIDPATHRVVEQRRSRVKRERVVVFSSEPEPHEWMFSAAVERHPASRCALHPQWARATAHQLG